MGMCKVKELLKKKERISKIVKESGGKKRVDERL